MKIKPYLNLFVCVLILTFFTPVYASDISSPSFIIRDPIIGTGGGYSASASFQLFESLEKSLTGLGTSATYIGEYGFLYFPAPTVEAPEDPTSSGGLGVYIPGLIGICRIADFNCDNHVNIFDLSILLYYNGKSGPEIRLYDLSGDDVVDFIDTSIVFYYWDEEFD